MDVDNPGLTGPVQNQPDFQAGSVDHRTHFAAEVPRLARQAMDEYAELTGREYSPVMTYDVEDADYVIVGLGSITDDVRAVVPYLRAQGHKVGVVSVKLLAPFPEAELVAALAGKKAVTVLERSDQTALTTFVTTALFKARANADGADHDVPAISALPRLTTAIFGLGGHDVQPRHTIAAFQHMIDGKTAPLIYLGSQFFSKNPTPHMAAIEDRLRVAYPATEHMALETAPNPTGLLPESAMRIRFHSVGGYGTIATGKLLTDILSGVLGMHSKAAPKYGSEKSGAPTNYYITLSPEPVLLTNAELEDVEVVLSPDHKAFVHTNPIKGLVEGGTLIIQSDLTPAEVWRHLPKYARTTIRERKIRFMIMDAFSVAKKHAPKPELETRMMGIAFIGAVAGHVDRVSKGASQEAILEKVRAQISKKFGSKGEAVVEGNMAVIRDAVDAVVRVDYDAPELVAIDADAAQPRLVRPSSASQEMCSSDAATAAGLFDPAYYEDIVARPFREGTIGESPVMPGVGLFMPAGSAGSKDKGLFRRTVPAFNPDLCTACMECALVCPDAAIPNTVHELHTLLLTTIDTLDLPEAQRAVLRAQVYPLSEGVRERFRNEKDAPAFHDLVAQVGAGLEVGSAMFARSLSALVEKLATFPVARTRPYFDAMEKATPGSGGLFSATIDPWKCTGCLECTEVCGPGALTPVDQDDDVLSTLQDRFDLLHKLPNTPPRFYEGSTSAEGDLKRLLLDHDNYYSTTGGHGACRGCGEVTAIRLVMSMSHALGEERREKHESVLTELLAGLGEKLASLDEAQTERRERISSLIATLERRLYLVESGPTGEGPASTIIANSTGCSSVYASTMPYNDYLDPWVNSLFQDAQPLAKGIFEGVAHDVVDEVRAMRTARLEMDDAYDPERHVKVMQRLTWNGLTKDELDLMPTIMTIGGDGASYDIGFGAMSRVLASNTPIKIMVLNSGAYSNTGGQTSTASFTGQDSDLSRFGGAHSGKVESRKELGLIASFHPNVYVASTSTAMHGHFLKCAMDYISYEHGPSVMDVYTPCGSENGIAEAASAARARLAVESRMSPLFVHDPRRGKTLYDWFSLDGNPDPDATWTTTTLEYLDASGSVQLMTTPLTPAEFALGETRFKKQFRKLPAASEDVAVPIDEYVELSIDDRVGKVPFVYATDEDRHLIKVQCSQQVVALVEDRRQYWQILQYLSGQHEKEVGAGYAEDLATITARYDEAMTLRESSMDDIARAMAELATSSKAPAGLSAPAPSLGAAPATAPAAAAGAATAVADRAVWLDPADQAKCTDCGTCYQELPMFFEKTTQIIDGQAVTVAQMKEGALEKVTITPEIAARIERVKATCDAEIIK